MRDPLVLGLILSLLALVLGILVAEKAGKAPEVHEGEGGGHASAPDAPAHGGHPHGHGH